MNIDEKAELLSQKTRHYLISKIGRWARDANEKEVFQALSYSLREEVMINWTATSRTIQEKKARQVYYLSMEYLPGRLLSNNINNLHAEELVDLALKKLGKNYKKIRSLEPDPGLGNGGLGRLASCLLDSMATQRYPGTGYGLRYQYGIFEQQLWKGEQIEKPDCWLLEENPWEYRRDQDAKIVKFGGMGKKFVNKCGEISQKLRNFEEVRALPYDFPIIGYSEKNDFNVLTLRLWSTKESPHNFHLQRYNAGLIGPAAENTALTDVLYPNDNHDTGKRIRLKQEFLLASASLQDIVRRHLSVFPDLTNFADKVRIQINDTHPTLIIAELMRVLTAEHNFPWHESWEIIQEVVGYTNHTILSEALEQWNQERLSCLLPIQYWIIEELNHALCTLVRKRYPEDEEKVRRLSIIEGGQVRMAHLAIYGAHKVNGVAKLHADILRKRVFRDFHELFPKKIIAVTNGVTQRHWLNLCNPSLAEWINEKIGRGWLTDFSLISQLKEVASDASAQEEFIEIKKRNKQRLIELIQKENPSRDSQGNPSHCESGMDPNSLFDVQVKRFHEYKRQLMNALHVIILYQELLENPESHAIKRTVIFSGKAAAGYEAAKQIIHCIDCLACTINEDPKIQGKLKVIFIENYGVSKAEVIIPAADLSEQISTAGMEASGTGNMKFSINGALTIGTEDGANIEMGEAIGNPWWPFSFGSKAQELEDLRKSNTYNPWNIYSTHPKIKKALDALKNGSFARNEKDQVALAAIFDSLMLGYYGVSADRFFVLKDLEEYHTTQQKVEALFSDTKRWARTAIMNIAGMGSFSTDVSLDNYAKKVWEIEKCPVDQGILKAVRDEFSQHDRYRDRILSI